MEVPALLIAGLLIALLAAFTVLRAVRIVPQAQARNGTADITAHCNPD